MGLEKVKELVAGSPGDPIELPASLPLNSATILVDFARGRRSWDRMVYASILTFAAYGYVVVGEKVFGSTVGGLSDSQAADELETALAVQGEGASAGGPLTVAVVTMLVEWALKKLLEKLGV